MLPLCYKTLFCILPLLHTPKDRSFSSLLLTEPILSSIRKTRERIEWECVQRVSYKASLVAEMEKYRIGVEKISVFWRNSRVSWAPSPHREGREKLDPCVIILSGNSYIPTTYKSIRSNIHWKRRKFLRAFSNILRQQKNSSLEERIGNFSVNFWTLVEFVPSFPTTKKKILNEKNIKSKRKFSSDRE